ncbi:hypothetical protein BSKO_12883 [Bryopsis sp. KO-2023]|nr:hypothetical protein BSKO_12883 [Bryopsis sp. KO-2023]
MASETAVITLEQCAEHTSRDSCWLAIDGKVYDVTEFLDDHPGGDDIIVEHAGKDATEPFEEIGHSKAARDMLDQYEIGTFKDTGPPKAKAVKNRGATIPASQATGLAKLFQVLLPVILLALAFGLKIMSDKTKKEQGEESEL